MENHLEKLLYLVNNDEEFVRLLTRHDDRRRPRLYNLEEIRYLQPLVFTVQIYSDDHMLAEMLRILDLPLIGKSQEQIVRFILAYDYTQLVDYAVYYDLNALNRSDIYSFWERINSLYFYLVFESILDFYPHI